MLFLSDFQHIGTLTKPHGIHGEINLTLLDQYILEEFDPKYLFFLLNDGLVPFKCLSIRHRSQQTFLIQFDSITSESMAKSFSGTKVYIDPKDLIENEENITAHALVGYKVKDINFGIVGEITNIIDIANNPLFQIDCKGKEVLIPIVDEFIIKLEQKKRELTIKAPEGLIEMYLEE